MENIDLASGRSSPLHDRSDDSSAIGHHILFLLIAITPVLFALSTWDTVGVPSWQDWLRVFSLPVVAVELAMIFFAMGKGFEPVRAVRSLSAWMQSALVMLAIIAFSTAWFVAPEQGVALIRTSTSAIHLLFGMSLYFVLAAHWRGFRPYLWPSVVVGLCAYILVLAAFIVAIPEPNRFNWERVGLGIINVRQFGFYSAAGAAAAIGLAATAHRPWRYWLATGAAAFLLGLSFWSGTRGSLVAVVVAFIAGLVWLPTVRNAKALAALVLSSTSGAVLSLIHAPPSALYGLVRISSSAGADSVDELGSQRLTMWLGTLRTAMERPLFGFGESQFRAVVPEAGGIFNHPHNLVLQILLQWGFAGALCFFSLAAVLMWHFCLTARQGAQDLAPPFLTAASLLIMAMYEGSFYHPYPVMVIAISFAFVLSWKESARP